jgi:hypothetical protein
MLVFADVGAATALLERLATSMAAGTVIASFVAAGWGVVTGRRRGEIEADALTSTFVGGIGGILCLLYDLWAR